MHAARLAMVSTEGRCAVKNAKKCFVAYVLYATLCTWLLDRKTSLGFRGNVRRTVEALGYDNISHDIPE